MRNMAMSVDASFHKLVQWKKSDLPISLQWRSTAWRTVMPTVWVLGWAIWIWVLKIDTSGRGLIAYAVLFIGLPTILAASAVWWVGQWRNRRHTAKLVINDDYLEWQFEMGSQIEMLSDCGPFKCMDTFGLDLRIEWDMTASWDRAGGWRQRARRWFTPDRTLYARDVGLDREDLDSLCRLLNQLRNEAKAQG